MSVYVTLHLPIMLISKFSTSHSKNWKAKDNKRDFDTWFNLKSGKSIVRHVCAYFARHDCAYFVRHDCAYFVRHDCTYFVRHDCAYFVRHDCAYFARHDCAYFARHDCAYFLFNFTAAGVVPCGGRKTSPRTSTIVQFIFDFGPLRSAIIF